MTIYKYFVRKFRTGLLLAQSWCVTIFVYSFKKNNNDIKEQVMWAFGIITGDSAKCRDAILNYTKFNYVYEFLAGVDFHKQSLIKMLSWVVSNFIRGKPQPTPDRVLPLFSFLKRVILGIHDVLLICLFRL
ncbi:unnamed protein product [Blepharisma stoltei]|uniref:Uncharacterized protein n=1 Tax=Blepharisma stoltei TaxID=1481888 RepID=A0AAU9JIE6_9CILI|nr:unnamed protein product [Blepharisma stoltei]